VGCEACNQTGYKGRKAIYEIISVDDDMSEHIRNHDINIEYLTQNHKIISLADSALELLSKGETSLSEIYPILISNVN
jgi:type IV pilus assembly protein PilB